MTDEIPIVCDACETNVVSLHDSSEPADPDMFGNRRYPFKCPTCGQKGNELFGAHGGSQVTQGFTALD